MSDVSTCLHCSHQWRYERYTPPPFHKEGECVGCEELIVYGEDE